MISPGSANSVSKLSKTIASVAIYIAAIFPAFAQQTTTPQSKVEAFHARLISVMKQAKTLSVEDRFKLLQPTVENSFDFKLMIALASGKYWRAATDPRQEDLRSAFARFSTATYADRFSGFTGEAFKTLSVANGPRRTMLVRTQITRPENTPIPLTYVTRLRDREWRIIDVLVDNGISELAVRRSEYRSVLKEQGISGLISLLKTKTKKLLQP